MFWSYKEAFDMLHISITLYIGLLIDLSNLIILTSNQPYALWQFDARGAPDHTASV